MHNTNKWYMHNTEDVQVIEAHKILWDFEITKSRPDDQT